MQCAILLHMRCTPPHASYSVSDLTTLAKVTNQAQVCWRDNNLFRSSFVSCGVNSRQYGVHNDHEIVIILYPRKVMSFSAVVVVFPRATEAAFCSSLVRG